MGDPVGRLLGAILMALGTLIFYGAYRDKSVFGEDGILTKAIATGSLSTKTDQYGEAEQAEGRPQPGPQFTAQQAVYSIAARDPELASALAVELAKVQASSTQTSLVPLRQLIALAQARGFEYEAVTLLNFVERVTAGARK